jgi:hypothetical protein
MQTRAARQKRTLSGGGAAQIRPASTGGGLNDVTREPLHQHRGVGFDDVGHIGVPPSLTALPADHKPACGPGASSDPATQQCRRAAGGGAGMGCSILSPLGLLTSTSMLACRTHVLGDTGGRRVLVRALPASAPASSCGGWLTAIVGSAKRRRSRQGEHSERRRALWWSSPPCATPVGQ